jgi:exonuclease SbcC
MKLKTLVIENITSLKGRHVIEFDQINGHSDLFAITGPTGSGKSSLLSSISLALFGKTTKQNLTAGDFISTGEAAATIELTFSLGIKVYLATWFCNIKKKNGEHRAKPQIVRNLVETSSLKQCQFEDLIDLDFNQFHKVAILNQGRFADFLHASFTERKELLETLIGDQAILEIGKNLKNTINYYKQEIEKLLELSKQATLLTTIEKEELERTILKYKKEIPALQLKTTNFNLISSNLESALVIKKKWNITKERLQKEKKEYETLLSALTSAKDQEYILKNNYQSTLDLHKKELPQLKLAIELNNQLSLIKHNLDKNHLKINNINKYIKNTILKNEKTNAVIAEKNNYYKTKYINLKNITEEEIENDLLKLAQYIKYSDIIKDINFQIAKYLEFTENYQEIINNKKKQIDELKKSLINNIEIKDIPQRLRKLEELLIAKDAHKQTQVINLEKQKQLNTLLIENQELAIKKNTSLNELNRENEKIHKDLLQLKDSLKQINESKRLMNNYQELIERFENSEHSCHVCSNDIDESKYLTTKKLLQKFEQQDSTTTDSATIEVINKAYSDSNATIRVTQEQVLELNNKTTSYKKELSLIQVTLEKSNKQVDDKELEKEKAELLRYLQIAPEWQEELAQVNLKYREACIKLDKRKEELATAKKKQEEIVGHKFILNIEEKDQDTLDKKRKEFGQYKVFMTEMDALKSNIKQNDIEIKEEKLNLKTFELTSTELTSKQSSLTTEYSNKKYPINPQEKIDLSKALLDEAKSQLHKQELKRRENDNSCQKKDSLIRTLNEQQDESNKLFLRYYSKFTELKELAMTLHTNDITKHLDKIKQWYVSDEVTDQHFSIEALSTLKKDIIDQNYDVLTNQLDENVKDNTICQTRLSENSKQEDKIAQIVNKQDLLQKELAKFLDLEEYIGKDRFRDYALSVIEKNLLVLANKEISQLADGRYKIIHAKEGKRSEFLVQDKWKGQTTRKVSTLSGGETFMLSLGLALALSNINRGTQEIGFFLIDEGFGSLDQDSINDVLECLMGLRSRGKQIGIISHVKELTSRIPINIELSKNQWGESTLSTVSM